MYATPSLRFALFTALVGSAYAQLNEAFVGQLRNAATAPERLALLKDSDLIFDFNNASSGIVTGSGGRTVEASSLNFPAVIGNGVAMTIGFLGPCAINTPHTHPRATEINFSVNGTLRAGVLSENGARFVLNDLRPGTASVFPVGAIHFEMNTGCETAVFVAAFNNEDPGVLSVAQRYFGLPPEVIGASLGGLGVEEVQGMESKIPDNVAAGSDECLKRCGLTRPAQPTGQRQPKVSGNSPAGVDGPPMSVFDSSPTSTATSTATTSTSAKAAVAVSPSTKGSSTSAATQTPANKDVKGAAELSSSASNSSNDTGTSPILIALVVINALLVVGLLVALFLYVQNRSRQSAFDSHRYAPPSAPADPLLKAERYELGHESTYYDPYTPPQPEAAKPS